MTETESVGTIVGRNARALRESVNATTEDVASAVRAAGLRWDTSRVSALESGRVSPTAPTLFALSQAFSEVTGTAVTVAQLLHSDGFAEIGDVGIRAQRLVEAFSGKVVHLRIQDYADSQDRVTHAVDVARETTRDLSMLPNSLRDVKGADLARVERQAGDAERKAAAAMGIPTLHLNAASAWLWHQSFSRERDERAGPNANAQRRGIVSRALKAEIQELLDGNDREL